MAKEIERKFLLKNNNYRHLGERKYYQQAYLTNNATKTIRVRIVEEKAWLTIKGRSNGLIRDEYEYEIPVDEAREIIEKLCEKPIVEKYRYRVQVENGIWEIDEFRGENDGLVVAEIELDSPEQIINRPEWIGEEVTYDARYYNSNLIRNPYKNWKTE